MAVPKKYEHIDFKPPQNVADAAERGLEYRRRSGKGGLSAQEAGKAGIGSGVQRAVNLKNRNNIAPETFSMMSGFFSRHEKNKKIDPENKDTPWEDAGHVAWLLWGGDPGKKWVDKIKKQMTDADEKEKKEEEAKKKKAGGITRLIPIWKNGVKKLTQVTPREWVYTWEVIPARKVIRVKQMLPEEAESKPERDYFLSIDEANKWIKVPGNNRKLTSLLPKQRVASAKNVVRKYLKKGKL